MSKKVEKLSKKPILNYILIAILAILAIWVIAGGFSNKISINSSKPSIADDLKGKKYAILFHLDSCPHCHHAKAFIDNTLKSEFPDVVFKEYEVSNPENAALMQAYGEKLQVRVGPVPFIVFSNDKYMFGFGSPEDSGKDYRNFLKDL